MLIDLYSAVIGGIIGGLVGFMTCILMAITTKSNRKPGKRAQKNCSAYHTDCQIECSDWHECDEWEG